MDTNQRSPQTVEPSKGIDISAPPLTLIYAVYDGVTVIMGNNDQPQDYGPTIPAHDINGRTPYILHGHLSLVSLQINLSVKQ